MSLLTSARTKISTYFLYPFDSSGGSFRSHNIDVTEWFIKSPNDFTVTVSCWSAGVCWVIVLELTCSNIKIHHTNRAGSRVWSEHKHPQKIRRFRANSATIENKTPDPYSLSHSPSNWSFIGVNRALQPREARSRLYNQNNNGSCACNAVNSQLGLQFKSHHTKYRNSKQSLDCPKLHDKLVS